MSHLSIHHLGSDVSMHGSSHPSMQIARVKYVCADAYTVLSQVLSLVMLPGKDSQAQRDAGTCLSGPAPEL